MRKLYQKTKALIRPGSLAGASVNRQIFQAASTVGMISLVVKFASMGKEVATANYFGRGDALDAYLIALMVPFFITSLVSVSMNAALVPTYVEVKRWEGEEAAQKLLSGAMVWTGTLLLTLSALLAVLAPVIFHLIAPGFGPEKIHLTVRLFYVLMPMILLSGVSTNCAGVLNSMKCFWLPACTPAISPLVMVVLLMTSSRVLGVWALPIGVVVGASCECALLITALRRRGISVRPKWSGQTAAIRTVRSQYIPLLIGSLMTSGVTIVDQTMAAQLHAGSVAALGYGNRVISMFVTLTSMSLSAAVIPHFSDMVSKREWKQCRHTLNTYSRLILVITVPLCIAIILLSKPLVILLFRHGAFSAQDADLVARIQAFYALQIPPFAVSILFVRLLTAMKRNDLVMTCALLNLVLDVILNLICIKFFGLPGIALSTSLFYMGSLTFAFIACRRVLARRMQAEVALST